ncbi:hypothetical protein ACFORL_10760 [Legionella dresdenensis]|uniref:Dot/Icm T4SS effector n=1 Tax=Legionella dresdenensis TaxID=450200 RepID=A0ABV8CGV5_9GAMM
MPKTFEQLIKQAQASLVTYKEAAKNGKVPAGSLESLQQMKDKLYRVMCTSLLQKSQRVKLAKLIYLYRDTEIELGFILLHNNFSKALELLQAKDMKGCEAVSNQMALNCKAMKYRITKLVEWEEKYRESLTGSQHYRGKMRVEEFNSFLSALIPLKTSFEPPSKPFTYGMENILSASGEEQPGTAIREAQQYVSTHDFSFFSNQTVEENTEIVALKGSASCA